MTSKLLASITALIGGVSVFYALLSAAGIEISSQLQDGITGLLGLVLIIAGIWLNPSIPVGEQPVQPEEEAQPVQPGP